MLEFLYDVLIFPIEYLMSFVLVNSIEISNSFIISIFTLSLFVTLLSLPFYHLAETWQDRERRLQKRLASKIADFKAVYKGAVLNSYVRTLYRQNRYHPIMALRGSLGLLIQIPFLIAAYHLISYFSDFTGSTTLLFKDLSKPDRLLKIGEISVNVMPFVMTALSLASVAVYAQKTSRKEKLQLYGISLLFLIFLYNSPSALLFYWTCNNIFTLLKNIVYVKIYKKGLISDRKPADKRDTSAFDRIFLLAVTGLAILTFIAVPMALMGSAAKADFNESLFEILPYLICVTTIFLPSIYLLYRETPLKTRSHLSSAAVALLICALLNVFIFYGNYGDMSNFVFENTDFNLSIKSWITTILFVPLFAVTLLTLKKNRSVLIKSCLSIIIVTLLLFSAYEAREYCSVQKSIKPIESSTSNELPDYFKFSKTGQNVLILMLDRFIGGYMPQILEFMPELKEELSGFTWYSRTLSQASYTLGGLPPILGGWEYTVHGINSSTTDKTLSEKINESLAVMPYNFNRAGFDSTIYQNNNFLKAGDRKILGDTVVSDLDYAKISKVWLKRRQIHLNSEFASTRRQLYIFGLFRISSEWLRGAVYSRGTWSLRFQNFPAKAQNDPDFVYSKYSNIQERGKSIQYYAALDMFPEMSGISEDSKNRFYFVTNNFTHEPGATDSNFKINTSGCSQFPKTIVEKYGNDINAVQHLYTDATALKLFVKWLKWMKENDVYDNTRIILVSDHGRYVYDPSFKSQDIPLKKEPLALPGSFDNILLVKDFNAQGELKKNSRFMTQASVPNIAMNGIVEGTNPYSGIPVKDPEEIFPLHLYYIHFRLEMQDKYKYAPMDHFIVPTDDDVFDPEKWQVATD